MLETTFTRQFINNVQGKPIAVTSKLAPLEYGYALDAAMSYLAGRETSRQWRCSSHVE